MRYLIVTVILISVLTVELSASIEASFGTDMQLNITTADLAYSWSLNGTVFFTMKYPFLGGVKYDYQDNFQRLSLLAAVRLLPEDWLLKIDLIIGGGIASIKSSAFKYPFFTCGISPKLFFGDTMNGAFIYTSVYYMDITTEIYAYSFLNGSVGVGYYF